LVSSDGNGLEANNSSSSPRISDDGKFVVFVSNATNLSSIITGGTQQIFIKDMDDGSIELASRDLSLNAANGVCSDPDVSNDGRYIVFTSTASDLTAIPGGGFPQIYYKDMSDESVDMVSLRTTLTTGATGNSNNTDMSADGQYIVFESNATDLISPSPTAAINIYFVDISTPTNIEHISVNTAGTDAFGNSLNPSVSNDGRYVAFDSIADNLVTPDNNGNNDVFLRDRNPSGSPTTSLVSANPSTGDSANGESASASISGDGAFIAFQSDATDIATGNNPGLTDIFVRDMESASITINQVNITETGIPNPTLGSANASTSSDGRYVSFDSRDRYTLEDDTSGISDAYRAYNSTF
jgi:Tol biopolymer transport system component